MKNLHKKFELDSFSFLLYKKNRFLGLALKDWGLSFAFLSIFAIILGYFLVNKYISNYTDIPTPVDLSANIVLTIFSSLILCLLIIIIIYSMPFTFFLEKMKFEDIHDAFPFIAKFQSKFQSNENKTNFIIPYISINATTIIVITFSFYITEIKNSQYNEDYVIFYLYIIIVTLIISLTSIMIFNYINTNIFSIQKIIRISIFLIANNLFMAFRVITILSALIFFIENQMVFFDIEISDNILKFIIIFIFCIFIGLHFSIFCRTPNWNSQIFMAVAVFAFFMLAYPGAVRVTEVLLSYMNIGGRMPVTARLTTNDTTSESKKFTTIKGCLIFKSRDTSLIFLPLKNNEITETESKIQCKTAFDPTTGKWSFTEQGTFYSYNNKSLTYLSE